MDDSNVKEKYGDLPSSLHEEDIVKGQEGSVAPLTLEKNFNLFSACSVGMTTGNAWAVLGGGIVASLYNGGPPGVIYEFIVVTVFYCFITASVAELASAIPASGGVYHWATVTAGRRWGRICGWFAGWLNCLAWAFACASNLVMISSMIVYSYSLYYPDVTPERWHILIPYLVICWACCLTIMFANRALPAISKLGTFFIIAGFVITIVVCATMPSKNGSGYKSSRFVWAEWSNKTGYSSNGFVFLAGMLNGAFAVGATDCVTHIAEEIPQAGRNVPKAMLCQLAIAFSTGLCYLIVLFYSVSDLDSIIESDSISPVGEIYLQATGSRAGAVGLLAVLIAPIFCATVGCFLATSRTFWALGRDDATPVASYVRAIDPRWHSPLWATLICGVFVTCFGGVYVGSLTAFNAFIGSFAVLTTLSYFMAIFPHLLCGRSNLRPGPFWMGKAGYVINSAACGYIAFSIVIFCFPYALPTSAQSMNYTCVITCGLAFLVGVWWMIHGRGKYIGPQVSGYEY